MRSDVAASPVLASQPGRIGAAAPYQAKIERVSPDTRRASFDEPASCLLGVSLENRNFVRPKLIGILEWIVRRFAHCTVLVGDSVHRITLETLRGLSPEAALAEALRLDRGFIEHERAVFESFAEYTTFTFLPCNEVQTWAAYPATHLQLVEWYQHDERFRAAVRALGQRLHHPHAMARSEAELEPRLQRSSAYLLEELAILACLRQRGLEVAVYPGSFSPLVELAEHHQVKALADLRDLVIVSLQLRSAASSRSPGMAAC